MTTLTQTFVEESAHEIFSQRNGLILARQIEDKIGKHQAVLIPATPVPSGSPIMNWEFKVIDEACVGELTFRDLDGRELVFRSDARPRARYLYFHYVLSLLRARRHNRKGWAKTMMKEVAWATPGRYMLRSMVQALVKVVGHELPAPVKGMLDANIIDRIPETRTSTHASGLDSPSR